METSFTMQAPLKKAFCTGTVIRFQPIVSQIGFVQGIKNMENTTSLCFTPVAHWIVCSAKTGITGRWMLKKVKGSALKD
jgi:hypothetical protein